MTSNANNQEAPTDGTVPSVSRMISLASPVPLPPETNSNGDHGATSIQPLAAPSQQIDTATAGAVAPSVDTAVTANDISRAPTVALKESVGVIVDSPPGGPTVSPVASSGIDQDRHDNDDEKKNTIDYDVQMAEHYKYIPSHLLRRHQFILDVVRRVMIEVSITANVAIITINAANAYACLSLDPRNEEQWRLHV
jgi:hypothetical protein